MLVLKMINMIALVIAIPITTWVAYILYIILANLPPGFKMPPIIDGIIILVPVIVALVCLIIVLSKYKPMDGR